ncbi:MAG: hypothetical protein JST81_08265 [Bacteroidetes bacterium]|jgi:hypothetical protein|nr:hypothetical protein [Bacteroidota bacterium]
MQKILLLNFLVLISIAAGAQETTSPDQNPNYRQSLEKYIAQKDNLQTTMNTTVQQTYKAYDWYEAKQERKRQRIEDRRARRLYEAQNFGYYYNPYNYLYDPYSTPFRYSPYYFHRHGWRHW